MTEWTREWPVEPGWYWLYGWCFHRHVRPAEFYYVKVRRTANGVCYITNNHFLYEAEGAAGLWCEAELPEPPDWEMHDD